MEVEEPMDENKESVESSDTDTQVETEVEEQAPAEESSVSEESESKPVPFHEHPRFKELIDEKNQLKNEVENLRRGMVEKQVQAQSQSKRQQMIARLQQHGVDPKLAEDLLSATEEIAHEKAQEETRPLWASTQQVRSDVTTESFKKRNPDFQDYAKGMSSIFASMSPTDKERLNGMSNSLDVLYKMAKADSLSSVEQEFEQKGRDEAYKSKSLKKSLTSSKGATTPAGNDLSKFLEEGDIDAYAKAQPGIDAALRRKFGQY